MPTSTVTSWSLLQAAFLSIQVTTIRFCTCDPSQLDTVLDGNIKNVKLIALALSLIIHGYDAKSQIKQCEAVDPLRLISLSSVTQSFLSSALLSSASSVSRAQRLKVGCCWPLLTRCQSTVTGTFLLFNCSSGSLQHHQTQCRHEFLAPWGWTETKHWIMSLSNIQCWANMCLNISYPIISSSLVTLLVSLN